MIEILEPLRDLPGPALRDRLDRFAAERQLFVVGGAIRDLTLGRPTRDLDLAGPEEPDRVARALTGRADCGQIDPALGTWNHVLEREDGVEIDLAYARFRSESDYGTDRRPTRLSFVESPSEDAARRDFTMNAIYLDWGDGQLVDPCGGIEDLADRTLRMVGDPALRLDEDPLRILRAIRFAGRLGLGVDERLDAQLIALGPRIASLSGQRLFEEWSGCFRGPGARAAFERSLGSSLFRAVDEGWDEDLRAAECKVHEGLGRLERWSFDSEASTAAVWGLLLGPSGVERRRSIWHRLAVPRAVRARVEALWTVCAKLGGAGEDLVASPGSGSEAGLDRALRMLANPQDPALLGVLTGQDPAPFGLTRRWSELLSGHAVIVDGRDLIARGVRPGPGFGEVLERVRRDLSNAGVTTRDEALTWLDHEFETGGAPRPNPDQAPAPRRR